MEFHSSTCLQAFAWRASNSQNTVSRASFALAAAWSANWLWRKAHSSRGERASHTFWWAATFVICTEHPWETSSAICIHKSAFGELILTGAPRRMRRNLRTTAWQSDQIINLSPLQAAKRTARITEQTTQPGRRFAGGQARLHYPKQWQDAKTTGQPRLQHGQQTSSQDNLDCNKTHPWRHALHHTQAMA